MYGLIIMHHLSDYTVRSLSYTCSCQWRKSWAFEPVWFRGNLSCVWASLTQRGSVLWLSQFDSKGICPVFEPVWLKGICPVIEPVWFNRNLSCVWASLPQREYVLCLSQFDSKGICPVFEPVWFKGNVSCDWASLTQRESVLWLSQFDSKGICPVTEPVWLKGNLSCDWASLTQRESVLTFFLVGGMKDCTILVFNIFVRVIRRKRKRNNKIDQNV